MSEAWPKAKWTDDKFQWFEDVADASAEANVFGLMRIQAAVCRSTGAILRLVRMNPASAQQAHLGAGSAVLIRGRGDAFGRWPWPDGDAHVAIVTPIHPIAIVVDAALCDCEAVLVGDGKAQRVKVSS